MSKAVFKKTDVSVIGKVVIQTAAALKLLDVKENKGEDGEFIEINNMTLINLLIKFTGPIHERNLTVMLMGVQVRFLLLCKSIHKEPPVLSDNDTPVTNRVYSLTFLRLLSVFIRLHSLTLD